MKRGIFQLCIALALMLSFVDVSLCELAWEATAIKVSAALTQAVVHAEFNFSNTGEDDISITTVRSSCACTTTALKKSTYKSGEKGQIEVSFDLSERLGAQRKSITVYTTEARKEATVLELDVSIPEIFVALPQGLIWKKTEPPEHKTLRLRNVLQSPVGIVEVQCSDRNYLVELRVIEQGLEYELDVTPVIMSRASMAAIYIKTDYKANNRSKTQEVHVYVR